jgi:hypothetical protein
MASVGAKVTTNLACLAVARNPHHSLGVLYSKTLRALAKMPNEYAYRKHTEQVKNKTILCCCFTFYCIILRVSFLTIKNQFFIQTFDMIE